MKRTLNVIIMVLIIFTCYGQEMNDYSWKTMLNSGNDFFTTKNQFETYLRNHYPENIPEDKMGNVKEYMRFVNFWKSRISIENGATSYNPYIEAINSYVSQGFCSEYDPANWELLGPSYLPDQYNGLVTQVLFDPYNPESFILSAEHAGVWKNQPTGNTWKNVTDELRLPGISCSEIIRNPFNNNHIIASTSSGTHFVGAGGYGQGIIESFDNGVTWNLMPGFPHSNYPQIARIIADPNDTNQSDGITLYALGDISLYKSTNSGIVWSIVNNLPSINPYCKLSDIEIADNGDIFLTIRALYDIGDGQIFKCHNNSWADITTNLPSFQQMFITKPFGGKLFAIVDAVERKIYKTIDYGLTWTYVRNTPGPGAKKEIEYSPESGIVYVGELDISFFKENNPSIMKSIRAFHMDIRDIELMGIDNSGYENILLATDGGISKLKVNTQNINDCPYFNLNGNYLPIQEFLGFGISHSNPTFIVGGAMHNNSFKYENGNWTRFYTGDGGDCEINWDDPNKYYYQGNSVMRSSSGLQYSQSDWFIGMEFEMNPVNPYIVYAGRGKGTNNRAKLLIFDEKGGSGGTGIITTKYAPSEISQIGAIGVNSLNVIYISDYSGNWETQPFRLAKSNDSGDSWIDLSNSMVYKKVGNTWVQHANLGTVLAWKSVEDILFNPDKPEEIWISISAMSPGNATGFMRILHSMNNGETWYDYSENLPPFPVSAIEYMRGSNDLLFAGTDAGVFYRTTQMNQWECFSKGLPVGIVSDLDYDPCSNKLYASIHGRSIYSTSVNFDDNYKFLTLPSNSEILWDKPVELTNSIIIPANTKLTITSSVYASPGVRIIVQPSAKLIINGGSITNRCGQTWQGIEVWGNTAQHQWPDGNGVYMQGYVELNNATIENAYEALNLWKPGDYTKTGGIVIANNSVFKNNRESVHAIQYQNYNPINHKPMDYQAIFTKCKFEIADEYHCSSDFYKHIDLNKVNGVRFNGCGFALSDRAQGVSNYNQAIASYSSGFKVNAICNSTQTPCPETEYEKCTFTGFRTAIYAGNGSLSTNTFYVNRAEFNNNSIGIDVKGVMYPIIINSTFNLSNNQFSTEECSYGIYLNNSTGFAIEDNEFFKAEGAPLADYLGIGIINCPTIVEIYKNEFTGLSAGNYAFGKNYYDRDFYHGVAFICNKNRHNYADFYVTGNKYEDCVQTKQGSVSNPAGNEFSSSDATWHFFNGTKNLIGYYYCSGCANQYPEYVENVTREPVVAVNSCLSHYGGHNPKEVVMNSQQKLTCETEFESSVGYLNNIKVLYDNLKDGGNTSVTVSDINNSTAAHMWEIRSQLLGDSPHLSKEVLKLVSDKTDVFTEAAIFDILAANPDELKKEELIKYIEEKENPLPEYMIDILKQVAEGNTYKTVLEQEMSRYTHDKARASNDMIRSILNEETVDLVQLRNWLSNLGGLESDKQIIATYLQENNFTNALSLANLLPQLYNLQGNDLEEHNDYFQLLQLQQTLYTENRTMDQLTPSEQGILNEIALSNQGFGGAQSKVILESFYDQHFNKCESLQGEASYKNHVINPNQLGEAYGLSISVKPNPASDWAAFDYTLPNEEASAILVITNPEGRVIETISLNGNQGQKLWDTRAVPTGSYIYTIKVAGFTKSGKLLIVK